MRHIIYWALGVGSLAALFIAAPRGALLTGTPARGKVTQDKTGKTVRGRGPAFVFLGGGYAGGK